MSSVHAVSQRLSLRTPQKESLEIIGKIADAIPMTKVLGAGIDPAEAFAKIKAVVPEAAEFTSFEDRTFPTVCLSLATAVGKTRLMAAIIAYLYSVKKVRNFFILAPNLTIYNKLIRDFTQGSAKYVFTGLGGLFPERPEIVTGENYEAGRGVFGTSFYDQDIVINIFNISKINSEERANGKPRIREMNEIIGQPYFKYLANLPDLVMLMDESHRYRGDAGLKALCQLNPVLGVELTATPHMNQAGKKKEQRFQNIVYDFPLSRAIESGYVKQPAVATRQNFDPRSSESEIELAKLEDGIHLHEDTKTHLDLFAKQNGLKRVKPFILIVARDITHAEAIQSRITSPNFFGGRYADKVITVHSEAGEGKEEKDSLVQELLNVEDPSNRIEIVIHVNMLKEGWDVNNLFTIVPLRKFDSMLLVEQSMGRGLRLPYGKRTGVPSVDKLNIVAHDHFQRIIELATEKKLPFQTTVIGVDVSATPSIVTRIPTKFEELTGSTEVSHQGGSAAPVLVVQPTSQPEKPVVFAPEEKVYLPYVLSAAAEICKNIGSANDLLSEDNLAKMTKLVEARSTGGQQTIDAVTPKVDIASVVKRAIEVHVATTIDVPRILLHPITQVKFTYRPFQVDCSSMNHNPTTETIVSQALDTLAKQKIEVKDDIQEESVDHLVGHLMTIKAIDYDESINELLFDLANQVVAHLRGRLKEEDDVRNVIKNNAKTYADVVYQQMKENMENVPIEYEVKVSTGAMPWNPAHISIVQGTTPRLYTQKTEAGTDIRSQVFVGFTRCISQAIRFDSDPERVFAVICEQTAEPVRAWTKPFRGQVQIHLRDGLYEPDFIVETDQEKLLVEVKAENELDTTSVIEKRDAAVLWCAEATKHGVVHGGKPWTYLLIPHNGFDQTWTLAGLKTRYAKSLPAAKTDGKVGG